MGFWGKFCRKEEINVRNIVVMRRSGKDKGKYVFTWTGNVVSPSTAKRYNNAYKKLIAEGFPPKEITVNMLHGNWYLTRPRYKGKKKMRTGYIEHEKLSKKTKRILDRQVQLKKTKAGKRTVYYSPKTGMVVKPQVVKKIKRFRFKVCGDIKVNLFRMGMDEGKVSHVIVWNVFDIYGADVRWNNLADFELWYTQYNIGAKLACYAKAVTRIAKKYPLDHGTSSQIMGSIRTRRKLSLTNQWEASQATFALLISNQVNLEELILYELHRRMDDMRRSLRRQETQGSAIGGLMLIRIYFFMMKSNPSQDIRNIAQYQKGIYNVR